MEHLKAISAIDPKSVILEEKPVRIEIRRAFNEYWMAFTAQMVEVFQKIEPERGRRLQGIRERIQKEEIGEGVFACPLPRIVVARRKAS